MSKKKQPHEWFRELLINKSRKSKGQSQVGKVFKSKADKADLIKKLLSQ